MMWIRIDDGGRMVARGKCRDPGEEQAPPSIDLVTLVIERW